MPTLEREALHMDATGAPKTYSRKVRARGNARTTEKLRKVSLRNDILPEI